MKIAIGKRAATNAVYGNGYCGTHYKSYRTTADARVDQNFAGGHGLTNRRVKGWRAVCTYG